MRIILLAGGSGGHISPAFAIASEFRKQIPSADILFLCSRSSLNIALFQQSGENFSPIFSGKIRRYFSLKNFIDPFFLVFGIFQCLFLFLRQRPDVIFSKGGFVAIPGCIAAWILHIPVFAHESDAVPGIATRVCEKFARRVFTTFPGKGICVGTPIRSEILQGNSTRGKEFLQFSEEKPILLGIGGSQGSQFLNTLLNASIDELLPEMNIVWITGSANEQSIAPRLGLRVFPYLQKELPDVLAVADVVVSRAGSNFLFELASLGKPMLLIPLASAAGDHQTKNAEVFGEKNAATVLLEENATPERFCREVKRIFANENFRKSLGENAKKMAIPNVAEKIVQEVLQEIRKG